MRPVALLSLLLLAGGLAGCTQGDPGDDGFAATCPSWVKGKSAQVVSPGVKLLYSNQTTQPDFDRWDFAEPVYNSDGSLQKEGQGLGDGLEAFMGHPLDFLVLDFTGAEIPGGRSILFVQDAEVKVRFFASDDGVPGGPLEAWDVTRGRDSAQHEWTFRSDAAKGYAFHNLTLRINLAEADQTPHPQGVFAYWTWVFDLDQDRDTASALVMGYSPEFWYRTCSADGTRL